MARSWLSDIGSWALASLRWAFFEHVDVFWDALGNGVVPQHLGREIDKLAWVETPTVGIEVVEKLGCHDVGVQ